MRTLRVPQSAVGVVVAVLAVASPSAQTMEKVNYFPDSIAEKDDHVVRLNGGSSWLLASNPTAAVASEVVVVMRDVLVNGQKVRAAWLYINGDEIPAKHVEGVYPSNPAYLTRVVAAERQGTTLRLADGTELSVPQYDRHSISRWVPPYKALLTGNRIYLYNLKTGRRVWVQAAKN
jgi:hypothetical protein